MNIAENIQQLKKDIPQNVSLVAVSKTKPIEDIMEAYHAGHSIFGENKVQELTQKYEALPKDIKWHFIGHLQTNKVKYIVPFVSLIHSVDSFKLLKTIEKEAQKINRKVNCLLQMHIAKESTKFGLDFTELSDILESEEVKNLKHVNICGLMGMATLTDDDEMIRSEFEYLKRTFDDVKNIYFPGSDTFKELSMGMSGDYQIAAEEGSTMIRIGSIIFGDRNY